MRNIQIILIDYLYNRVGINRQPHVLVNPLEGKNNKFKIFVEGYLLSKFYGEHKIVVF